MSKKQTKKAVKKVAKKPAPKKAAKKPSLKSEIGTLRAHVVDLSNRVAALEKAQVPATTPAEAEVVNPQDENEFG